MHTTPVSLLERLRQPEEQGAWTRFVQLYTPLLYRWACRAGLRGHEAADLIQDVFTTLVEKMPGFRYDEHKSFRAWLRTITRNKWRDRCKARSLPTVGRPACDVADAAGPDPLEELAEVEYRQQLARRALELMQADFQPNTWKACWESVVEERPAAEVAAELGISESAVYSATCRVLGRLRQELKGLLE